MNAGEGTVSRRLAVLFDRWQLKPGEDSILFAEVDLNRDGAPELVTDLKGSGWVRETGAVFVIYKKDGGYEVDRSRPCDRGYAALHAVTDLTSDGRPDIIWSCTALAAHSPLAWVFASNWEPGRFRDLPGEMSIRKMRIEFRDKDLLLHRDLIGSPGAGGAQRSRTDRYRFVDGAFRLVDRVYALAEDAYFRLHDGIVAETRLRRPPATRSQRPQA